MELNLDLNFPPTILAEGDLVSSSSNIDRGAALEAPNNEIIGSTIIDLEATDDDVELFLSPAWLKRRNSSRTNQLYQVEQVPPMRSEYTVEEPVTTLSLNSFNYHERILMRTEVIDCELYSSSEGSYAAKVSQMVATPHPAPQPLPSKEPVFNCPVCWDELTCPCSTVCGHIFCRHCIAEYIKRQKKCPTCRKRLTRRNFHRVFLPATETV